MLEIIIIAVIGTTLAGIWDLKTTEVPDQLPYAMVGIGVGYWILQGILTADWQPLLISLLVGTALLAAGLVMYRKGQWGGADAWILAAIGYTLPVYGGAVFIVPYLMNFLIVSIVYTVVYALVIGLLHAHIFNDVAKDLRAHARIVIGAPAAVAAAVMLVAAQLPPAIALLPRLVPLIFLLLLFWRYAVVIEKKVFRRKVPVGKLKVGDVIEDGKWIGLTAKDIRRLRRTKRYVVVKDGMRFVPVFAIALVVTLLYGNVFLMVLG